MKKTVTENTCLTQKNKIAVPLFFFLFFNCTITAQILWQAPAGQGWLVVGNWTGNLVPLATDIAQFGTAPTSGVTGVGINMNNPTNNGANNQAVGAIEITSARTANFKIGNSSTSVPGTLTLNGATVNTITDVILRNNSTGLFTIDTIQALGSTSMSVALNNSIDNKIYIDNSGGISINTVLQGAGSKLSLNGAGSGVLQLNAANTYTGPTTVWAATLRLNKAGGGTLPAGNDMIINGGTVKISSSQILHNVTLAAGATITIDAGITLTVNGTFFCNGGVINGAGTIAYGTGATLSYGSASTQLTTAAEFPALSGPENLLINNAFGVSLHANRTIAGVLTLANGIFILGNNNFTTTGTNAVASVSTHVVTDGIGKLIITNINTGNTVFPIGATTGTINPVVIANGNHANYGARVEMGFPIAIADAAKAVNRTWFIESLSTPAATVDVSFFYSPGDGNISFSYVSPVDHGIYLPFGLGWNINQAGLPQSGTYRVDTKISSFLAATDLPMVIGNLGAVLDSKPPIALSVQKQYNKIYLSWTVNTGNVISQTAVERSADGINFISIKAMGNSVSSFEDAVLLPGTNYYRIKLTDIAGKIMYSNIVPVFYTKSDFDIVGIQTAPVNNILLVKVNTAKKMQVIIVVTDISGRRVQQQACVLNTGNTIAALHVAGLAAGVYQLTGYAADGNFATCRFIKQ